MTSRLRAGQDSTEREAHDLVKAERHAASVGPLNLRIAYGRARLAEAFVAVPVIQGFELNSCLVKQGLRCAVQRRRPVPVTQVGGQGR